MMVEGAREVSGLVRVGGKNRKSVWWKDGIKAAVRRKEAAWKGVLAPSDEETKKRCMEEYREEKRKVKKCIIQSKKKRVNELFGRKMNKDVNGNRKSFWKVVSNAKGGNMESCRRVKDEIGVWHRERTKRER